MQTFLPYGADFKRTAQELDYRRLGKQRVEAFQILQALRGISKGWRNHPATKMWDGYEIALCHYGMIMCKEWIKRGYKDTLLPRFEEILKECKGKGYPDVYPRWLWEGQVALSHQSNLIRKNPEFYGPKWPGMSDDLPYVWPSNKENNND